MKDTSLNRPNIFGRMKSRASTASVLTFLAVGLLLIEIVSWSQSARFGPTLNLISRCSSQIVALSAGDRTSGLQLGDTLLLDKMDAPTRVAVFYRYLPMQISRAGQTVKLIVQRDEQILTVPYLFRHTDSFTTFLAQLGFKLFVLGVGLFVLWRGRDRASLLLGFWSAGVSVALPDAWWGALPTAGQLLGGLITGAIWTYSPFVLYLVIESIATNVPRQVMLAARAAMALLVAPAFFSSTVNEATQALTGCSLVALSPWIVNALFTASQLVIVAFFVFSYVRSTGVVKQRIRWIFWAFLISRFGVLLNLFNRLSTHPVHLSGVEWLTVMIFPLGCAYAILRHRIIDVNFVLNRTLVYTILTTFAVGVFVLLEDILTKIAAGHGVSLAVELAVALALGFSFNALHRRTEIILERTLFRRKHEAALRLQRLSEEAPYIEGADALLTRAMSDITQAVGAREAAVYERRDGAYRLAAASAAPQMPGAIPIDDPAFVRLRKDLSQVDLSDVTSAMGGEGLAFALAVRGQLFGAFFCGRSIDGETYAPDEIVMLRKVLHEVGAELHAIRDRERGDLLEGIVSGAVNVEAARSRLSAIT
jgi:hypothetical protein